MNNPIVFTDFHHAGLLNSLIMLFEGRFGGKVFRPIGAEWYEKGFWKIYEHPATVQQFLGIGASTPDGTPKLNEVVASTSEKVGDVLETVIYHCQDIEGEKWKSNKAITFNGFMQTKIDIVIASIPAHIEPFRKLCELHPNKPKLIYQIGNQWIPEQGTALNMMASTNMAPIPGTHFINYHQEFDLNVFKAIEYKVLGEDWEPLPNIFSFVNVFQDFPDFELFKRIESLMPSWVFKSYGGQCRDGSKNGTQEVADAMRESKFIWHTKYGGDGYGHVLYNSAAVGRPTIVKREYYNGKMGQELLEDGVTCIAIDNLDSQQIIDKINYYSEPERYKQMCQNVYTNFKNKVDFDKEAELLKTFVDNLL